MKSVRYPYMILEIISRIFLIAAQVIPQRIIFFVTPLSIVFLLHFNKTQSLHLFRLTVYSRFHLTRNHHHFPKIHHLRFLYHYQTNLPLNFHPYTLPNQNHQELSVVDLYYPNNQLQKTLSDGFTIQMNALSTLSKQLQMPYLRPPSPATNQRSSLLRLLFYF